MCVTPPGSTKQLSVVEVGPPDVNRISTADAASHLDFAPQYDQPFSMSSWTGGVGQLYFDGNDQTGYWWGNVSTHVDGKIYPPFVPSSYTHTIAADYTFYTKTAGAGRAIFKSWVTSAGVRTDYSYIDDSLMIIDPSSGSTTKAAPLSNSTFLATDMTFFEGVVVVCSPDNTVAGNDFWTYTVAAGPGTAAARNHTPFAVGSRPKFMCPVRDTLFAAVDNGLIYYTVDPTTDAWVGPIEASDKNFPWQNMVAVGDYLFCFTTAAGYSIDAAQRVEEVFWQWKDNPSTENFKCVATTGGRLYYNIGPEVYEYDPVATDGNNRSLSLARRDGFSVQQILGITTDEKYVYVQAKVRIPTLYSSSQMVILRGVRQPNGRINFECIYQETFVAAQYDRALTARPYGAGVNVYWATVDTGTGYGKVKHIYLPPDWDESFLLSTNGGYTYGEGYLYTSITRANYPDFVKRHLWLALELEGTYNSNVVPAVSSGGNVTSVNATYATAQAGSGLSTTAVSGQLSVGQRLGASYALAQSYIDFDTSLIPDGATNITPVLRMTCADFGSISVAPPAFTIQARAYDFGASVTTGDYLTPTQLGTKTLVASIASSAVDFDVPFDMTSDAAFAAAINLTGSTRLVLTTDRVVAGSAPTLNNDEYPRLYDWSNGVAEWRPTLFVTYTLAGVETTLTFGHGGTGIVEVAYSIDKGRSFTVLGNSLSADDDGNLVLSLSDVSAPTFMLRFKLTSSDGSSTPVIRVFDHHQRVRFKYLPQVQAGARCATGLDRLNGQPDTNRTQMDILDSLRTLRATDSAILYEDYLGNSFYVSLDSVSYRPTRHEKPTEKGEQEALITMSRADAGT